MQSNSTLSHAVIGAAIEVHRTLGPGLLESIYEDALFYELELSNLKAERQVPIPVIYKEAEIRTPLYLDILVENSLIIEIKACEENHPIHQTQLLTYLRLTGLQKGLIINFGKHRLLDGVQRIVNGF